MWEIEYVQQHNGKGIDRGMLSAVKQNGSEGREINTREGRDGERESSVREAHSHSGSSVSRQRCETVWSHSLRRRGR